MMNETVREQKITKDLASPYLLVHRETTKVRGEIETQICNLDHVA
jgi:hypothetical protein